MHLCGTLLDRLSGGDCASHRKIHPLIGQDRQRSGHAVCSPYSVRLMLGLLFRGRGRCLPLLSAGVSATDPILRTLPCASMHASRCGSPPFTPRGRHRLLSLDSLLGVAKLLLSPWSFPKNCLSLLSLSKITPALRNSPSSAHFPLLGETTRPGRQRLLRIPLQLARLAN